MRANAAAEEVGEGQLDAEREEVDRGEEGREPPRDEDVLLVPAHGLDDDPGSLVRFTDGNEPVEPGRRLKCEAGVHRERVNLRVVSKTSFHQSDS